MIAMGMMQPSAHEVIDMVAMGHDFVPTGRAMLVRAARFAACIARDWWHLLESRDEWALSARISEALPLITVETGLRNVVANYPFESLRRFPGSEPNSGQGDHSRLSCSAGIRSSGGFCRGLQQAFYTAGGKASNTIAQFALDFPRKQSVCGDHGRRA